MRNKVCRMLASLLAIIMISTGIVFANAKKAEASTRVTYKVTTYGDESTDYFGYVLTPDVDYKVQALIYIHGNSGIEKNGVTWPDKLNEEMTKWNALGYIDPMVIIIPRANIGNVDAEKGNKMKVFVEEQFEKLLDATITGTISSKIDTSKDVVVSGLSMGGAAAVYAGVLFNDKIKNVGALSPANDVRNAYDVTGGWINKNSEIIFSEAEGSHYLVAASKTENGGLHYDVAQNIAKACGEKYGIKEYYIEESGHVWDLFVDELFYFLYYVQNDVTPSASICNDMENLVAAAPEGLTSYEPSVLNGGDGKITGVDETMEYSTYIDFQNAKPCTGTEITGLFAGDYYIRVAATASTPAGNAKKITVYPGPDPMAPAAPEGIKTFEPSVLNGGDGKITGVDTTMEYSTYIDFQNAKPCTGTEITGLFAGDYYIRVAATDTTPAGNIKKVTVYPGPAPEGSDSTTTPTPSAEVTTAPSTGNFEDLIERLYVVALGRESDPEGKAFWANEVKTGIRTGGDCAKEFLISPEFLEKNMSTEDFVEVLYKTFFDRASEPEGKAYWVDKLDTKSLDKVEVIKCFVNSTEWCNICARYGVKPGNTTAYATEPSANAIEFASRLYTKCLGREAEEEGLKFWSLSLTNLEITGTKAAYQFFTSAEFVGFKTSDEEYIERLYETFMGRASDADGMAFWLKELEDGKTRDDVLYGFADSKEFTEICNTYGIDR